MQIFGKYETNFDRDYLTEHYIYFNAPDETITTQEFEAMLKKKRKTVAGTFILFHPQTSPKGYTLCNFLQEQGFEDYGKFITLNEDAMSYVINAALKHQYEGKLVAIKYLFNYNREDFTQKLPILDEIEADIEKLKSSQLTRHDKHLNYQDIPNIAINGKFVFLGMGHKFEREHTMIPYYAISLVQQIQKLGKEIVFIYDRNFDEDEALKIAYFLSPLMQGKYKEKMAQALKEVFSTTPPKRVRVS
ncbi:MAG: hypothetical protein FAF05_00010 [Epsilonproteobacteria bacterium]|nr:hypothetical protein [Campylobacterota bacterium]